MLSVLRREFGFVRDEASCAIAGPTEIPFAALAAQAAAFGAGLAARPDERVIVSTGDPAAFVAGVFGAWSAGRVVELHGASASAVVRPRGARPDVALVVDAGTGARNVTFGELSAEVSALGARVVKRGQAPRVMSLLPLGDPFGLILGVLVPFASGGTVVAWGCDGASPHALVAANRVDVLVCERTALDALLEPAQEIPRALAIVAVGDLDGATHLGIALRHGVTVLELFGTHGAGSIATRASPLFRYSPLTGVCVAAAADGRLEVQSPWAASVTLSERVKRATDGTFERVRERAESSVARHGPARWNVDARGESESEFVQLPNDLVFFRGHFDAVPILPGVAQLIAIVLPTARRRFPDLGALRRLRRVRFRRPLLPGETVAVVVHRDEREVRFELRVGAVIATQGTLVFDSAADAS